MPKVTLSFDLIKYENYFIDIEQTGEPQLTVSKDGEELKLTFASGYEYKMFCELLKNRIATDQNGRRVYVTSLSRQ